MVLLFITVIRYNLLDLCNQSGITVIIMFNITAIIQSRGMYCIGARTYIQFVQINNITTVNQIQTVTTWPRFCIELLRYIVYIYVSVSNWYIYVRYF